MAARSARAAGGELSRPACIGSLALALAFVKEELGMVTPPSCAALPIFTDDDTKPHARATVAVLAPFAQLEHAITQFVTHDPSVRRRWSNRDWRLSLRRAILWRDDDPRSVATLRVATVLVIAVAPCSRLPL